MRTAWGIYHVSPRDEILIKNPYGATVIKLCFIEQTDGANFSKLSAGVIQSLDQVVFNQRGISLKFLALEPYTQKGLW